MQPHLNTIVVLSVGARFQEEVLNFYLQVPEFTFQTYNFRIRISNFKFPLSNFDFQLFDNSNDRGTELQWPGGTFGSRAGGTLQGGSPHQLFKKMLSKNPLRIL